MDDVDPEFKGLVLKKVRRTNKEEINVCYLIHIGLNKRQIGNITEIPTTTVWRWFKKNEWILNRQMETTIDKEEHK